MSNVARMGDLCTGHNEYPSRKSLRGSGDVFVNNRPAHRAGDQWDRHCKSKGRPVTVGDYYTRGKQSGGGCHDSQLLVGCPNVFVNNKTLGRAGDIIACGSRVMTGSGDVFACGSAPSVAAITVPAQAASVPQFPNSFENARRIIAEIGYSAIDDDPTTNDGKQVYPPEQPKNPPPDDPPVNPVPPTNCTDIREPIDYRFKLSSNITLGDVTINTIFPHGIRAQYGLSIQDIVCNLKAVAENVIEPLIAKFGRPRINSGFRTMTGGRSQHERGQAVDMQWTDWGRRDHRYFEVADFVQNSLNFDQLILEHGNSIWIHVSFNRAGNRSASTGRKVMTMINDTYQSGLRIYS